MATIVNLNRLRKHRERAEAERRAAEHRARFGRTKEERKRDLWEGARAKRDLDDRRLE